ncbi:hypothetical protein OH76DRAFT_1060029 [Lentinus brumalis]|uniref:RING-type domain-containing protein n=1 Tax=Lentinus brumalis TaxID=2498619 RepID=A0A371DND5_9APHY|nr:hypothetical protein OH76DRAFT_1060029 [Polyporus brumalis]
MPSTVLCSICQDIHAIADIRSLPCGHTYCATCIPAYLAATRATRGKYPCPQCRAPFKNSEPHPIFLDHGDSASQAGGRSAEPVCHSGPFHRQVASALREVTRVEEDQRAQTVQRAAQEMEKVTELMSGRDCLLGLLTAVAARWRGILPLFSTIAKQRADIAHLRGQLQEAREQTKRAERVAEEAVKEAEKTLPTLQSTQKELLEAKITLQQLKKTMISQADEHKTELEANKQHVSRLHDQLHALKLHVRHNNKEEIRKLREEAKPKICHLQAAASRETKALANRTQSELEVLSPRTNRISAHSQVSEYTSSTMRKRKRSRDDDELLSSDEDPDSLLYITHTLSPRAKDAPAPQRPPPVVKPLSFSADPWQLPSQQVNRSKSGSRALQRPASSTNPLGLLLDAKGKPLAPVQTGSRRRAKF